MSEFKFKQFSVKNESSAMKVNTDGVLLGAWMDIGREEKQLLDIGTGTGVIALMAAQRSAAMGIRERSICAIEIDSVSSQEAEFNFENSPWREMLRVENVSIQDFSKECPIKFDLIFTNPPYFIDSLKAPQKRRNVARHTDLLSHQDIIKSVISLISPNGRFALILPSGEAQQFITESGRSGFRLCRICKVKMTLDSDPKRYLMEFYIKKGRLAPFDVAEDIPYQELVIETEEYKSLTKDFYLKF